MYQLDLASYSSQCYSSASRIDLYLRLTITFFGCDELKGEGTALLHTETIPRFQLIDYLGSLLVPASKKATCINSPLIFYFYQYGKNKNTNFLNGATSQLDVSTWYWYHPQYYCGTVVLVFFATKESKKNQKTTTTKSNVKKKRK